MQPGRHENTKKKYVGFLRVFVLSWLPFAPVSAAGQAAPGQAGGCPNDSAHFHPCALAKAKTFKPPMGPDGHPDLQGLWDAPTVPGGQSIEEHRGEYGFGATNSKIVDPADGKVPYQPWAAAQRKENPDHYIDPYAFCFPTGVPRQMYNAGSRRIIQLPDTVTILSERGHLSRVVLMDGRPHAGADIKLWMGDSRGHWEGNTLVVDVTNLNGRPWFDLLGHFGSDALHVVERLTLVDANTLDYEATIEDPKVYTRPWTLALPLVRNQEYDEIWEEGCHEGISITPTISNLRSLGYKFYPGITPPK
jgi:hypothetical protein